MRSPLPGLCAVFCLGILIAAYLRSSPVVFFVSAFLSLALAFIFLKQDRRCAVFICAAVFSLGAATLRNFQVLPPCHIVKTTPYKNAAAVLTGVIDSDPVYRRQDVSFILKVEKTAEGNSWQKSDGKVLVKVSPRGPFSYGDRLLLRGSLCRPFSFSKGFDYRNYLRRQGIYHVLNVGRNKGAIRRLGGNAGVPLVAFSYRIKHSLRQAIVKSMSPFSASVLNALILGDRQDLFRSFLDILIKLGTVHILPRLYTKMPSFAL